MPASEPISESMSEPAGKLSSEADSFVTLGKVVGFFGVRGWIKVHSDTEPRENIVAFKQWWLGDERRRESQRVVVDVTNGKRSGKNVVAKLDGIDSREQAEKMLGKEIAVPRSLLPTLGNEEYYWTDLIGCEVVDLNHKLIGPVKRLFETGANDVMVVSDARTDSAAPGAEVLIPWIRPSVITQIDLQERRIIVDWDPEFLA